MLVPFERKGFCLELISTSGLYVVLLRPLARTCFAVH